MKNDALDPRPKPGDVLALYKPGRETLGLYKVERITPSGQITLSGLSRNFTAGGSQIGGYSPRNCVRWPTEQDRADHRRVKLVNALLAVPWGRQTDEIREAVAKLLGIEVDTQRRSHVTDRRGLYCSNVCKFACPEYRLNRGRATVLMLSKLPRGRETSLERAMYAMLDGIGVPYLRQHVIGGKFCVDAFVPDTGIVLEFDGDYWHANPARYPIPNKRQRIAMGRDKAKNAYVAACGFQMVRIWEHDAKTTPSSVSERLRAALGVE